MLSFNQDQDDFRPKNRSKPINSVDIIQTLKTFTVNDVVERIQKMSKQKNIRIAEFMRDFDKLRSGSISQTQFLSCLSILKIYLSREESELLVEKFKNPNIPSEVLWRNFCDENDLVFGVKQLEKREDVNILTNLAKTNFITNEISLEEEALLNQILKQMKEFFDVKRLDPKPAFLNYDNLKRGKVMKNQFKKICHSIKFLINDQEIDALMKKYGDPVSKEINYILILNDTNELVYNPNDEEEPKKIDITPVLSSSNNYYTYKTYFKDLDKNAYEALEKIKYKAKVNRVRIGQFFEEYDTLRKGFVSKAKFRTALDMANLGLTEKEFTLLEEAFADEKDINRIKYKDLVDEVDKVFNLKKMEKNPLDRPEIYSVPDFLNPSKRMTSEENEILHEIMIKLGYLMLKYRVIPKSYFKDADKPNVGIIPSSKFSSYLTFLKLEVSEKEMSLLIKRFHAKTNIEINYYDFDNVLNGYVKLLNSD